MSSFNAKRLVTYTVEDYAEWREECVGVPGDHTFLRHEITLDGARDPSTPRRHADWLWDLN
jgi:hypothetical protein